MKVTAQQLKELDPKQFEKEYWRWTEHANDWEWWDYVEEGFREDCKPLGIDVSDISFDTYPWQAAFKGRADVSTWMKHCKLDEKWYPLWLAIDADGSTVSIDPSRRSGRAELEWNCRVAYVDPLGVFADMPDADWTDMIQALWTEADLMQAFDDFVRDLCHDLARKLESAYDHETSEENFLDYCEANEVTFDYEGDEDEIQG